MKTLVISAIIAMTSLVNVVSAAAVNRTDNFAYNTETNDGRVEYALWNEQSNAYTDIKQKAVYRQTDSSVLRYLSYEWDEKNNDWSLTADHHMTDESVQLLAEK